MRLLASTLLSSPNWHYSQRPSTGTRLISFITFAQSPMTSWPTHHKPQFWDLNSHRLIISFEPKLQLAKFEYSTETDLYFTNNKKLGRGCYSQRLHYKPKLVNPLNNKLTIERRESPWNDIPLWCSLQCTSFQPKKKGGFEVNRLQYLWFHRSILNLAL